MENMTVQDCLDYLEDKRRAIKWLIQGLGIHGLKISDLRHKNFTTEWIIIHYNADEDYFND